MTALPLLFLMASVVLVATVLLVTFFQVAFSGPRPGVASASRLPLLAGEDLKRWATEFAHCIVAEQTRTGRNAATPAAIATAVTRGTSQVLERTHGSRRAHSDLRCLSGRRELIAVTAPEALAIAEELRQRSGPLADQVQSRARANSDRLSRLSDDELSTAAVDCPLASESGECITFAARPLYCRGRCPECVAAGKPCQGEQPNVIGDFASTLGAGVTAGLTTGLDAAGLDGQLYELNSALSVALDAPQAAARWAAGEPVFAGCRHPV